MTDKQLRTYHKAVRLIVDKGRCPACRSRVEDVGKKHGAPGHYYCPVDGPVLGDCHSLPDGHGGFLNSDLCRVLGI